MSHLSRVVMCVVACVTLGLASHANAVLIASESFATTSNGAGGTYDDLPFKDGSNPGVVVGNVGFSAANSWDTNTGTLLADDNAPTGLSHSLVSDSISGAARFNRHFIRNAERPLASATPSSLVFTMSGIVRADVVATNGDFFSMGMHDGGLANSTVDISNGLHLGMFRDDSIASGELRLGAFGGGLQFDLGAASLDTNYWIALRLTANAAGNDELEAWVAEDGGMLTKVLSGQVLETFTGASDLNTFLLQQTDASASSAVPAWADEFRFGTTLGDLGIVPEPATATLAAFGMLGLIARRRRSV